MKKYSKAFTLSEALIALTVIGVVAAITMPIVFNSSYKKEYPAKLKKFFTSMSTAVRQSEQEPHKVNGSYKDEYSTNWDYSLNADTFYDTYLAPYLIGDKKKEGGYFLNDGSNYEITAITDCMEITYDLNGTQKPNKYGVDKFAFLICKGNKAKANNLAAFDTYNLAGNPSRSTLVTKCGNGGDDAKYCTRLLQVDGWEYKSDYPWAE